MIGHWRKGDPCYKVAKNISKLGSCSSVLWKVQLMSNEIEYLAEEISKPNVEGVARFLLNACGKMGDMRNDLKMGLLTKEELEIKDLKISQPIHFAKK